MALLVPGLVVQQALVRQRCQAEASIADPDVLLLVGQDFCRDVNQKTLLLWNHLARPLMSMHEDKLVDAVSRVTPSHKLPALLNVLQNHLFYSLKRQAEIAVGKSDGASRK